MLFHVGVFVAFGLNRFVWAWLSAWPAVLFATQFIGSLLFSVARGLSNKVGHHLGLIR